MRTQASDKVQTTKAHCSPIASRDRAMRGWREVVQPSMRNLKSFAALVSQTKPKLRYFSVDKPLHTIVSMTVYAETRKSEIETAKQTKTVPAFGDPIYTKEQAEGTNGRQPGQVEHERVRKKNRMLTPRLITCKSVV